MAMVTRRSLYRHLATVHLQPRELIECAFVLRAYTLLCTRASLLKETSARLGFADPKTLSDLLREWTGTNARGIQASITPDELVALLATRLLSNTRVPLPMPAIP